MNAKLTPGIILIALVIGTLYGPATTLATGITRDQFVDLGFWLDLAAAGITSAAREFLAVVALVATALGLPMYQTARAAAAAAKSDATS